MTIMDMFSVQFFLFLLLAYFSGSIPTAKLIGNRHGIDIQKTGSGNIGFANTVRVLGWGPGFLVLFGDTLKGFLPVILAKPHLDTNQLAAVGLLAILGHIFPVWLKFNGGKGIATGFGITLALDPSLALLGVLVYLMVILVVRKSAPSSIISSWSLPLFSLGIARDLFVFYLGLALLATWTHRTNIAKLMATRIKYDD